MKWLRKILPNKIKYQLILGVALVHAVLMTFFVFDLANREQNFLLEHSKKQATSLASVISANALPWVLSNNLSGLNEIIQAQADFPNLSYVLISSPEGEILAHSRKELVGKYLIDSTSSEMLRSHEHELLLDYSVNNIEVAHQIHVDDRIVGWIRVSLSNESVNENLQNIVIEGVIYTTAAILIGSVIAWILGNSLTTRIRKLINATKELKPNKSSVQFGTVVNDEVGELMDNFNLMEKQLQQQFEEIQNMAYQDALTHLYSRAYFDIAYDKSSELNQKESLTSGLVIVDIDNFKQLNDSYGHDIGDSLLIEIGKRIRKFIKENDYAFRFGGDEFVILLTNLKPMTARGVVESLVQQLQVIISKPCQLGQLVYSPQFSIGIHIIGQNSSKQEAFKKTDIALYNSKRNGKGQTTFFEESMEDEVRQRSFYEEGLKTALEKHEMSWVIQPQMDMQQESVVGGEVLIRWYYRDQWIRPDLFIPITEENQTIIPISNWLLEEVFKWIKEHELHEYTISINLSPVHFFDSSLLPYLRRLLRTYQISPYSVKFEVTEGVFLEKMDIALGVINKLKNLGFKISLDDFGTGFSSLSYLKNLPIDQLKIDKSFIDGLPSNEKPAAITKTIIDLTRNLELNVIAEGVETVEQKEFLLANNCTYCQGYLYSKPISPDEFLDFSQEYK